MDNVTREEFEAALLVIHRRLDALSAELAPAAPAPAKVTCTGCVPRCLECPDAG